MKFIVTENYDEVSKIGAQYIKDQICQKPDSILGLATGSTPVGMYNNLINAYKEGLDFSRVKTFNLDEYYGLSPEHPQSYKYFMKEKLFEHINIDERNINIPNGLAPNIEKECLEYDNLINCAGGIDLQVLGIGRNGHIGFNEPGEYLEVMTHITDLTEDTIIANSRFFDSIKDVPRKAITMGLGTIMRARKILLLASGKDKAPVIGKITKPIVDTKIPASMLHLHKDVIAIVDKDAASLIDYKNI